MKVLFIAPLPPPITGHSLVSKVLLDALARQHRIEVVDLSVGSSNDGSVSVRRLREVAKILMSVVRRGGGADAGYLTIAESFAGNLKDLLIYLLWSRRLSRMYLHLHGGSIKRLLFDRHPLVRRLNALAIRRVGGVIISGRSHEQIFAGMVAPGRLHIVPNFAPESLFIPLATVEGKFASVRPLSVLYLSGMTTGKGYLDLAHAYLRLSDETKGMVQLDFAGRFDSDAECAAFKALIAGTGGIRYHGLVDDATKARLFAEAHVFCLPTAMFEGQPISILEAYAAGCVVVATGQAGILDVFQSGINGFEVETNDPASIGAIIRRLVAMDATALAAIAMRNRRIAETEYRTDAFTTRVANILFGRPIDVTS